MWNMLNCAEQGQIQKYRTHAYKTLKTLGHVYNVDVNLNHNGWKLAVNQLTGFTRRAITTEIHICHTYMTSLLPSPLHNHRKVLAISGHNTMIAYILPYLRAWDLEWRSRLLKQVSKCRVWLCLSSQQVLKKTWLVSIQTQTNVKSILWIIGARKPSYLPWISILQNKLGLSFNDSRGCWSIMKFIQNDSEMYKKISRKVFFISHTPMNLNGGQGHSNLYNKESNSSNDLYLPCFQNFLAIVSLTESPITKVQASSWHFTIEWLRTF